MSEYNFFTFSIWNIYYLPSNFTANGKNFGVNAVDMIFTSDKYMTDRAPPIPSEAEELIVTLTSDKGMCGGTNSNIIRNVRDYI